MDPTQAKMMLYVMPIMITSFMLFLPAGLCVYMVTNSILGIVQQRWVIGRLDKKDGHAAARVGEPAAQATPPSSIGTDGNGQSSGSRLAAKAKFKKKRRTRRARP
jgi:YidC/Oxa1 family membrane protein insertase